MGIYMIASKTLNEYVKDIKNIVISCYFCMWLCKLVTVI